MGDVAAMTRKRLLVAMTLVLAGLLAAAAIFVVRQTFLKPRTITAYFTTATAIYPGDDVRVSGVKVGRIAAIEPDGTQTRLILNIDRDVKIPADATAVIVAQNLLSARYVQLTPTYRSSGPIMPDGAVIPVGHTAVPVEWDQVKEQLTRLATELGPNSNVSTPSVSRFIDSAANALDGNGEKLRQTLAQLSGVGRILASGSGNIVEIIKNLQKFVTALRDSKEQIVQFQDRLATLTSVLNGSRSDLDAALTNLSEAVGEVQRFVAGTRAQVSEQIRRLADVTQNLVDHRMDLEQVLHVAPPALSNTYNMFDPRTGAASGVFVLNNMSNPVGFFCGMISAIENVTATETGKLCAQYLGPALRLANFNYLPFGFNPLLTGVPPWQDLIYSEPRLEPGGEGPKPAPPDLPPSVSAYTGLPRDTPGADWPPSQPSAAPPAVAPFRLPAMEPVPGPVPMDAPDVLFPAERPPS
jgi:phospholipid/cholesterol/gamma-HCH transport system substrate-binding protein